jgi:vacuolar iron transporter family protein
MSPNFLSLFLDTSPFFCYANLSQTKSDRSTVYTHIEQHFTGSKTVRDLVIGMADGLTVPFALAAGLTGATSNHWIIIVAAAAEMAAGAIAMGLGGYLATKSEADTYAAELDREYQETRELPEHERQEVQEVFSNYGLKGDTLDAAVNAITSDRHAWVKFMMREELGLEKVDPGRALQSGLTIGGAYILGGLFPLFPYFLSIPVIRALFYSICVTLIALFAFGWFKGKFTGMVKWKSALQTMLVGGLAAGTAYGIARMISTLAPGF